MNSAHVIGNAFGWVALAPHPPPFTVPNVKITPGEGLALMAIRLELYVPFW